MGWLSPHHRLWHRDVREIALVLVTAIVMVAPVMGEGTVAVALVRRMIIEDVWPDVAP